MPARAFVFQKMQLGKEVTMGTAVAANRILQATSWRPRPNTPGTPFRPVGNKFNTDRLSEKEWSSGDIEGTLAYNDLAYLCHSVIENPGAAVFTYKPNAWDPDAFQSYTAEYGDPNQAIRIAGLVVTSLGIRFTRSACEVRGTFMGEPIEESFAQTLAPTKVNKVVAHPKKTKVEVGDAVGSLVKLTRCLEAGFAFNERYTGLFTLDDAEASYSDVVEQAPDYTAQIIVEHETVAAGLMADLRNATQKFLRITSTSAQTHGASIPYSAQFTLPFKFAENDRGEQQSVLGSTFNLMPDYEAVFDSGIEVVISTDLAGL